MFVFKPQTLSRDRRAGFWQRVIIVLLAVAVTAPVIMKSRPSGVNSPLAAFLVETSAQGHVRISGDVRHPGIYPLTANLMTVSAIGLAEPLKVPTAYLPTESQTWRLRNGADMRIELRPDGTAMITSGSLPTAQRLVLGIPLDINAMNETDFDRVPGIGPVLAKRIVIYRQKHGGSMAVQELLFIEGIGQKKYLRLHKFFN
jgi:competence protein ComEA